MHRQIFPRRNVDSGLAAHTAVNLCQKCCRDLNKTDTAHPDCRGKPGHIPHNTAAQSHDDAVTVKSGLCRRRQNLIQVPEILKFLTVGKLTN